MTAIATTIPRARLDFAHRVGALERVQLLL